ncbi:MAG: transferase hexapeptide repeat family protein [Bacteroidota bacterium]|jgi:phenylacetic acid degradation protein/carnitine operon protein CaiE|nr:transferase hexapeptide repeat family protein [Bacteroidota bacterium]
MIYKFKAAHPIIDPSAYVHPQATVIGSVKIGKDVFIGAHAVLRGDFGSIIIEDGCNVQENCTIHMFPGTTVYLHKNAHIGHGAIIHGATIGQNVLIGMNAVIMDDVHIGENSIIGALAFIPAKMEIPAKSLVVGNPAKIIKEVNDEMIQWKTAGTSLYQSLPALYQEHLMVCEPLASGDLDKQHAFPTYEIWEQIKQKKAAQ